MDDDLKKAFLEAIEANAEAAGNDGDAGEAMKFAQSALNLAQAMYTTVDVLAKIRTGT